MTHFNTLAAIPPVSEKRVAVYVNAPAQRSIRSGHPWLFESSIVKQSHEGESGDLAVIFDQNKKFLAIGLYDPFSPIRVRVLHVGKSTTINEQWFTDKIANCHQKRAFLLEQDTNGYRVISGENDGLPGLVVDRYAETLVVKIYTAAWVKHLDAVLAALLAEIPAERVVLRMNRLAQQDKSLLFGLCNADVLYGAPLNGVVVFKENGVYFESDPIHGQKTGFFLDQRDNRARVEAISQHRDVLNVFSYTGGFSLYAARGGAKSVTSLDISKPAIEGSVRNFELNFDDETVRNCPHEYIADDAFKAMASLRKEGKSFDVVIIDPPSFAKKKEEIKGAIAAYSQLVKLGLGLLRRGGTLVMASCSSRVGADEFFEMVMRSASEVKRPLRELERSQHAVDHPIGFPEGAYLKCIFCKG